VGRKKHTEQEHENQERWLLTYADLITLLLAFFIVMYSMSKVDAKKFGAVSMALQGVLHGGRTALNGKTLGVPAEDTPMETLAANGLQRLQSRIWRTVQSGIDSTKITTSLDERGLTIHVMEKAFFESGKADLTETARSELDAIATELGGIRNYIRVEGHTDDIPIHNDEFASNWELSSARATKVLRYLLDQYGFTPDLLSASGYAEYRPLYPNDSGQNRSRNRRVDIVILSSEFSSAEPAALAAATRERDLAEAQAALFGVMPGNAQPPSPLRPQDTRATAP
jgi:chemotaxis protein MotB